MAGLDAEWRLFTFVLLPVESVNGSGAVVSFYNQCFAVEFKAGFYSCDAGNVKALRCTTTE